MSNKIVQDFQKLIFGSKRKYFWGTFFASVLVAVFFLILSRFGSEGGGSDYKGGKVNFADELVWLEAVEKADDDELIFSPPGTSLGKKLMFQVQSERKGVAALIEVDNDNALKVVTDEIILVPKKEFVIEQGGSRFEVEVDERDIGKIFCLITANSQKELKHKLGAKKLMIALAHESPEGLCRSLTAIAE